MREKHFQHGIAYLLLPKDEVKSKRKQDGTVGDISKHNSEKKREGDDSKERRIGLLVSCYSIGFYDLMGRSGEIVDSVIGGEFVDGAIDELSGRQCQLILDGGEDIL